MADSNDIYQRIPHRPPFLWVDRIVSLQGEEIEAEKTIPPDLALFAGHYPGQPILPGVLVCEAIFQAGALLLAEKMQTSENDRGMVPVLTRIMGAKFKRQVRPGDILRLQAQISERVGPAWFLKGKAMVNDTIAVKVEFAVAMVEADK